MYVNCPNNVKPVLSCNTLGNKKPGKMENPFKVNVEMSGTTVTADIDTGSAVSAINDVTFGTHFATMELKTNDMILKAYNGTLFQPLGYFVAKVKYKKKCRPIKLYVIKGGGPNILGRD